MDINFKLYQDNDYDDLIQMILFLYDEDPGGEPIDEYKINATINEFKRNPQKINIYMFEKHGENIGYAILVYFWSNEWGGNILIIDELYVGENHRGKGVATEFFSFAENFENIAAVQLETTPSNQRVLEYYKRLGFAPCQNTHLIKPRVDLKC